MNLTTEFVYIIFIYKTNFDVTVVDREWSSFFSICRTFYTSTLKFMCVLFILGIVFSIVVFIFYETNAQLKTETLKSAQSKLIIYCYKQNFTILSFTVLVLAAENIYTTRHCHSSIDAGLSHELYNLLQQKSCFLTLLVLHFCSFLPLSTVNCKHPTFKMSVNKPMSKTQVHVMKWVINKWKFPFSRS